MKNILNKIMIFIIITFMTIIVLPAKQKVSAQTPTNKLFEFRGAWVATVSNIDIGKQTGTTISDINSYKSQFLSILDTFEAYNLNTVIFQVRPINDAFYQSQINPWSRFLIGTEGKDPGWDPMAWMIEECHKRGMEFHAWLNPYRASLGVLPEFGDYTQALTSYLATLDNKNFAKNNPDLLVRGIHTTNDARILLNPSKPKVRQHIYDTIEEIVRNYNVDAIHFDDYFYNGVRDEEDNKDYDEYKLQATAPIMTKANWRREQVNILIKDINTLLKNLNSQLNKRVEFGISPAGVWAPADNMGCGARGQAGGMPGILCGSYSSFYDLYADSRKWVQEEWIDYIIPQNYGGLDNSDGSPANHRFITQWWANEVKNVKTKLYMGMAPYQYNTANQGWDVSELENQMNYGDSFSTLNGYAMYNITQLKTPVNANMTQAMEILKNRWNQPALNPIKNPPTLNIFPLPEITTTRNTNYVNLNFKNISNIYGYFVYRVESGQSFSLSTAKVFDVVPNFIGGDFTVKHKAENLVNYDYYIRTVYKDGQIRSTLTKLTTGIYDYNVAPKLENLKIDSDLLFFDFRQWVELSGDVYDANGDDLTITITLVTPSYTREYIIKQNSGHFSELVFIPQFTINKGYFTVNVNDGLQTVLQKTYSFYTPASNYPEVLKYIMTMEIIMNETLDNIYR